MLIHASSSKRGGWILTDAQSGTLCRSKSVLCRTDLDDLPFGAIIGSVEIVDCVINHPSIWAERTVNYISGLNPKVYEEVMERKIIYNWVLANPILFKEPIPAKGKLSFWDYPNIDSEDGICLCQIAVDEKNQVMDLCGEYRCWYCGGRWSK